MNTPSDTRPPRRRRGVSLATRLATAAVGVSFAAFFVLIYAWVMILVNGRYPEDAFKFIVGVTRWGYRVQAYAWLLNTDKYPPFSLD